MIPKHKIINGKRYKLSSQDMSKSKAKQLAKELRENGRYLARIISEPNPKKIGWKQNRYRVYSKRLK